MKPAASNTAESPFAPRRRGNGWLLTGLAAMLWIAAGPVLAQEGQTAPPDEAGEETADAPGEDEVALETVTVTANKRVQNVREVAGSISIVDETQLKNLHANSLTDFASYVPGLFVTSLGAPGQTTISLRGIAPINGSAAVGIYVDDIPLGSSGFYQRQAAFMPDLLPYALERIVVLRGPQGTLYGAGAIGGILKYVTANPDPDRLTMRVGAGVSAIEGSGELGWDARLGANIPLVDDRLALRVDYGRHEIPGFIDNAATGEEDINEGTQESARFDLLWLPSDDVSLELVAMRQSVDSRNNAEVALDPQTLEPLYGELTNSTHFDERFDKEMELYFATLDWDLGWADFKSVTGYTDVKTSQRSDASLVFGELPLAFGQPPGLSTFDLSLHLQKFTQEFRLVSKPGRFEWLVGAFYTEEDAENLQLARLFTAEREPFPGLSVLADISIPSQYSETAIFTHGSYDLTDALELDAGLRFSSIDQDFTQIIAPGSPLVPAGTVPGSADEEIVTWSLAPKYEFSDGLMLYAKAATGYQPGGPNVALPNVPPTVDSSETINYELGLKAQFLDGRARVDLTAFRIDWQDIQVAAAEGGVNYLTNAGEATSQGLEFASVFMPVNGLRLTFNAAWINAELTEDGPLVAGFRTGLDGDELPYVPEFSWSATANYFLPMGGAWSANLGAGLRWVGERESSLTSTLPTAFSSPELDSYYALDLHAGFTNGAWTLRFYGRNVTDERAYLTIAPITGPLTGTTSRLSAVPIQPRTFGVAVDYRY